MILRLCEGFKQSRHRARPRRKLKLYDLASTVLRTHNEANPNS